MEKREEHFHLLQLQQDDLQSFKWLYRKYCKQVYHFCYGLVKSVQDAEEITSDVFVKLWEKRSYINPDLPILPFLFKISKDLTWNHLKKTSRSKRLKEAFIHNYLRSITTNGENEIIFKEYLEVINRAIHKLTPQQKKIFALRYFSNKDLGQIATELEISKNTVKVHLAKSKRSVMDFLKVHADW